MAALAGGTVTQIARISQIFCTATLAEGLARGFILLLAVLAKSINLVNFFSSGILSGFGVYEI